MSTERRVIGRLPVTRGLWSAINTYYKYNMVTNGGSSFIAIRDTAFTGGAYEPGVRYDVGTNTFVVTINGVDQTPETQYWQLMSYGEDAATVAQLVANKADGNGKVENIDGVDYVVARIAEEANDLSGSSSDRVYESFTGLIRTTAGSLSIKSDTNSARLTNIKGELDSQSRPFTGKKFRWNGFNEIHSGQVFTGSVTGSTLIAGNTNYYWINVPQLVCSGNNLNNATENNGMLFTKKVAGVIGKATADDIRVYWTENYPAVGGTVNLLSPTAQSDGYRHFVCNKGYLLIELVGTVTLAELCAHIAWSGAWNDDWEAESNGDVIDFTTPANAIHTWGMAGFFDNNKGIGVYDEIVFDDEVTANRKWYARTDRSALNDWTLGADIEEGDVTYHQASMTIAAMKEYGLYDYNIVNLIQSLAADITAIVDNTTINIKFTTSRTAAQLNSLIGSTYFYFEKATETSGTHSISGTGTPNDLSTEEIVEAGAAVTGNCITDVSYIQGLKDFLRLLPTKIAVIEKVVADHIVSLKDDIDAINKHFSEPLGPTYVEYIDMLKKPKFNGYNWIIEDTADPTTAPNFIGQFFINTSSHKAWIATSITGTASTDWKQITNA